MQELLGIPTLKGFIFATLKLNFCKRWDILHSMAISYIVEYGYQLYTAIYPVLHSTLQHSCQPYAYYQLGSMVINDNWKHGYRLYLAVWLFVALYSMIINHTRQYSFHLYYAIWLPVVLGSTVINDTWQHGCQPYYRSVAISCAGQYSC